MSSNKCCPPIRMVCAHISKRRAMAKAERKAQAAMGGFSVKGSFAKITQSLLAKQKTCYVKVGKSKSKKMTPQEAGRYVNALKAKQVAHRCVPDVKY